jgi:E3 ubiquitin-protein ligase UBR1/E3 ubiquitin-protein ligase UBR3
LWQVQERGYFQLKPKWWTEFDPLFAQFYLNELEDAQVCRFIIVPTSCGFHDKILDARIDNIS